MTGESTMIDERSPASKSAEGGGAEMDWLMTKGGRWQLRCPWCAQAAVLLFLHGAEQCSECCQVVYGSDEGAERVGQLPEAA